MLELKIKKALGMHNYILIDVQHAHTKSMQVCQLPVKIPHITEVVAADPLLYNC